MWDEITHSFPKCNIATVEVWEWLSNLWWDKVNFIYIREQSTITLAETAIIRLHGKILQHIVLQQETSRGL